MHYNDGKGTIIYIEKGLLHRDNGPACITPTYKIWAVGGNYHRDNGPAIMYLDHPVIGKNFCQWWFINKTTNLPEYQSQATIDDATFQTHWNNHA